MAEPVNARVADIYEASSKLSRYAFEPYWPEKKLKICVTGAGGFIASHLAKRLKSEGHYIIGCDWKRNEHMPEEVFCDEFVLVDLRVFDNCRKVVEGCEHVFNLAADMGGMGFIQSNHSVSMNQMMEMVMGFDGMKKGIKHIPGPEGVRGRNSDNKLILEKLGWEPTIKLEDGLRVTYGWIKGELEKEAKEQGKDISEYSHSMVVGTQAPKELGTLRAADGLEEYSGKK
ncbi:hypothetical protein CHLNCDRAFT_140350 [Chlorella variabilis]|uniref:NAD-dependent epimerase/dehydratase domain-containing protein n=1 Tax=Chlorella variabilis TaxID=554065 RepID=E1Z6U4_CHLVA|nr:hypothetical protein CHLNCDRAFT_140350 [Chlorella variabilis]EFN58708.1 hypothetical protein CHLNCDRAFT_140350 [Chlorella variabilis]|eukprot:XP_005850810.1 hypothetical protein CHLNCDRAFT_140350 [Chlorella variabilis]